MKTAITFLFFVSIFTAKSQSLYEYYFDNNFDGSNGGGTLSPLVSCGAQPGAFGLDSIMTINGFCSYSVEFCFNPGGGLSYPNNSITQQYSINLFCEFNALGGWTRIIDFSNSTSDAGFYLLGNCLNFYPNGNVGPCPYFVPGVYYLYTFVRNSATDIISVYINGTLFASYLDATNLYACATNTTPIKFFRDDNAVPCEVKAGCVKYLSISADILSAAEVDSIWQNICTISLPPCNASITYPGSPFCDYITSPQNVTQTGTTGGVYDFSPAGLVIDTLTGAIIPSQSIPGTYTVSYTFSNPGICLDSVVTTTLTISSMTADAGNDITICSGQGSQLNASGGIIYSWNPPVGLSDPAIANPFASPLSTTVYVVTITDSIGCTETDSMTLTVNIVIANAGLDVQICGAGSITLNASGGISYAWSPAVSLSDPNISNPVASPAATTTYTVTVTDANGCSNTDDVVVTVFNVFADAGADVQICSGDSTQLNASGGLIYSWLPAVGLSDAFISNPIAAPTATTTYVVSCQVETGNLIVNGDFSSGNTGFTSGYIYTPPPNTTEGQYWVGTNAQVWNGGMNACGDHTTGSGNMLLVNGATTPNISVYCETVSVTPNTDYAFSTWLATLTAGNLAQLQFSINGILLGSIFTANATPCVWDQFYTTWNSGANTAATICVVNQNTGAGANDFALDDISFSAFCTATDSVTVTIANSLSAQITPDDSICLGSSISLLVSGGNNYVWIPATGLSCSNCPNPTASPTTTTTYTVVVSVANCTDTVFTTITVLPNPVVSAGNDVSICAGDNTQLSASGATSYSWSPAIGLNNALISNPVAMPTSSTTYIVTGTIGGCSSTDDVIVSILPAPAVNPSPDQTICLGDSAQLSVAAATIYI